MQRLEAQIHIEYIYLSNLKHFGRYCHSTGSTSHPIDLYYHGIEIEFLMKIEQSNNSVLWKQNQHEDKDNCFGTQICEVFVICLPRNQLK